MFGVSMRHYIHLAASTLRLWREKDMECPDPQRPGNLYRRISHHLRSDEVLVINDRTNLV